MWILDPTSGESKAITQPEAAYNAYPSANYVYDTRKLRFTYGSLVSPASTYDYDLDTGARTLLKEKEVGSLALPTPLQQ